MEINKGDLEDSDNEEEVLVDLNSVDTAAHKRVLVTIDNEKVPITFELVGHSGKYYMGVKVTMFNQVALKDEGFFLIVNQKQWELTAE